MNIFRKHHTSKKSNAISVWYSKSVWNAIRSCSASCMHQSIYNAVTDPGIMGDSDDTIQGEIRQDGEVLSWKKEWPIIHHWMQHLPYNDQPIFWEGFLFHVAPSTNISYITIARSKTTSGKRFIYIECSRSLRIVSSFGVLSCDKYDIKLFFSQFRIVLRTAVTFRKLQIFRHCLSRRFVLMSSSLHAMTKAIVCMKQADISTMTKYRDDRLPLV